MEGRHIPGGVYPYIYPGWCIAQYVSQDPGFKAGFSLLFASQDPGFKAGFCASLPLRTPGLRRVFDSFYTFSQETQERRVFTLLVKKPGNNQNGQKALEWPTILAKSVKLALSARAPRGARPPPRAEN